MMRWLDRLTTTQCLWLAVLVFVVVFVPFYYLTIWALNHGYLRWVLLGMGVSAALLIVLLNRALRGTWALW